MPGGEERPADPGCFSLPDDTVYVIIDPYIYRPEKIQKINKGEDEYERLRAALAGLQGKKGE